MLYPGSMASQYPRTKFNKPCFGLDAKHNCTKNKFQQNMHDERHLELIVKIFKCITTGLTLSRFWSWCTQHYAHTNRFHQTNIVAIYILCILARFVIINDSSLHSKVGDHHGANVDPLFIERVGCSMF